MDKAVDNPEQQPDVAPEGGQSATAACADVAAPEVAAEAEPAAVLTVGVEPTTAPAKDPAEDEPAAEEPTGGEPAVGAEAPAVVDDKPMAAASGAAAEESTEPVESADSRASASAESQTAAAPAAEPAEPVPGEAASVEAEPATPGKPHKRVLTGTVVSNGSEQSVVIRIAHRKKHRLYKKYRNLTKKVMAHDPANDCQVGDLVRVIESRPLSRMKRWRLVEIVKRAN